VEIEVSDAGIEGQLVPPGPGVVRLVTLDGVESETTADDVGCFTFQTRLQGPIRLACCSRAGQITTEWITT
jgi:hypothetical protein